jgi:hypothetical protein
MISQLRPSIHHLGDQIIWVNSEISKGRRHFNVELTNGVYELFPEITWSPDITRYGHLFEIDYGCKFTKFNQDSFTPVSIPEKPYITIQFDTTQSNSIEITPEVRAYVISEDYKKFIIKKYKDLGFDIVDVGGMRWSLSETAYIMKHSQGHVGSSSGFGVFSRCVGVSFTHIYYNCNLREYMQILPDHFTGYVQLFSLNGIRHFFKDDNLNICI